MDSPLAQKLSAVGYQKIPFPEKIRLFLEKSPLRGNFTGKYLMQGIGA
jgi:hypothetical protein